MKTNVTWGRKLSEVAEELKVDVDKGLTAEEAAERLNTYGPNEPAEAKKDSPLEIFLEQFGNSFLIILLAGAVICSYTGHWVDASG